MTKTERQREKRKENKQFALQYLGGVCSYCRAIENLQFDHKDRRTKVANISQLLSSSRAALINELNKCQLLCLKCHQLKTLIDLEHLAASDQHGTLTSYTHGKCRCVPCKDFWNMMTRKYKAAVA